VQVSGLTDVSAVCGGGDFSLALKSEGTVWTWGQNNSGQLGDGTTKDPRLVAAQVMGLTGITSVAGYATDSYALKSDGTVWAWGSNSTGFCGDGTTTERHTPVQVSGLTNVIAIAGATALKSDGTVWDWGPNGNGQLGDGTTTERDSPVQVSGLTDVIAISMYSQRMALKKDGTVWAWGPNSKGQIGDGTTTDRYIPVQVNGLSGVVAIATGLQHSLAVKSDGTVWGWGDNYYGQLGNIGVTSTPVPVKIPGLSNVAAVSAGRFFSFAIQSPDAPSLAGVSPANAAKDVPVNSSITWIPVPFVTQDFQLSKTQDFSILMADVKNLSGNTYAPSTPLEAGTTYYWRIRSRSGPSYTSDWVAGSFTTVSPVIVTTPAAAAQLLTTPPAQTTVVIQTTITAQSPKTSSAGSSILIALAALACGAILATAVLKLRGKKKP